jgi:hypothetical protein
MPVVAVATVWAAATVSGPLATSVAADDVVASATRIVLAVNEELDFSDKTLIKIANEMITLVATSDTHQSSKHLAITEWSVFGLCTP